MEDKDTQRATRQRQPDRPNEIHQRPGGRADDRNEELDDSPVPDPEEDSEPEDDPEAD
jgi:hypothetical protein